MGSYLGCKIIKAEAMDLVDFNEKFQRHTQPAEGHGTEGYCVEYPDGYKSWSPKSVFENTYRPITKEERDLING